jgi:hypothetical protein
MRTIVFFAVGALLLPVVAPAELIWDNYLPGGKNHLGVPGPGYDGLNIKSSERDTRIDDSWTGDDATFEQPVELQSIKWIGALVQEAGAVFQAADVIVFKDPGYFPILPSDPNFVANIVYEQWDLPLSMDLGIIEPLFGNKRMYEGTVDLPDITLAPGHYYYSVRVVGNLFGKNYVATTGFGTHGDEGGTRANDFGIYQSYSFYYPPYSDSWVYASQTPQTDPSEYAYRLYGEFVPEPACALMLGLAGLALRLRR